MKDQKGKKAVKPYDRQSASAPIGSLTLPTIELSSPYPRLVLNHGTRPAFADWTRFHTGMDFATSTSGAELFTRKIPGLLKTDAYAFIPVETPRSLQHVKVQGFANGSALGGNNTCFTGYEELRDFLTRTFRNEQGSYLDKINAAFDKYCALVPHEDNGFDDYNKKPDGSESDDKGLSWSSSMFVDYLCFLFNYFIPRPPFGHETGSAEAFNLEGGRSRDRVIEYLLSVCTGVIFRKKSVSSHSQTVRNLVGGTKANDPRRLSPEYQSLALDKGFTHDFPGTANPMMEDFEWMARFYRVKKTAKGCDSQGRCPLILPPVIAAILDPATSVSTIDLKRLGRSFDFSRWLLPEGLQSWWQKEQAEKKGKKLAKDQEQMLREGAELEIAPTPSATAGPKIEKKKQTLPEPYLGTRYPSTSPECATYQPRRIADDSDHIIPGVQLDEQSVRFYPSYYVAPSRPKLDLEELRAKQAAAKMRLEMAVTSTEYTTFQIRQDLVDSDPIVQGVQMNEVRTERRYYVAQCRPDPRLRLRSVEGTADKERREMMTRGDRFLSQCKDAYPYTPTTRTSEASSRSIFNGDSVTGASVNAIAGPGPSTLDNRSRFFKGSKCWA